MRLSFRLNGKQIETDVKPDMLLLDLVRELGCYSVKRGFPSSHTVQRPQFAVSQPLFTL